MTQIVNYIVYEISTGAIVRYGSCPDDIVGLQAADASEAAIQGDGTNLDNFVIMSTIVSKYVNTATIDKTTVLADETDSVLISNIPTDALLSVYLNDEPLFSQVIPDNTSSIVFSEPGEYKVLIRLFPYLDKEFLIDAT